VATLLALVAVVSVAGLAGIRWSYGEAVAQRNAATREAERAEQQAADARREKERVDANADQARREEYVAQVGRADGQLLVGDHAAALQVLERVRPEHQSHWEYRCLCGGRRAPP
jgi:hypothetical protein